jgi:transcriptional regulator with XRE-family HTH domain
MDTNKKYKNNLLVYRKRMGFSQKQVACLLNQHDADMLSRYERGHILPSLITALGLEIAYRVPVAFLFPDLYEELRDQIRSREASSAGSV